MVRKYRSRVPRTIGLSAATLALLVGIAMVVPNPTSDVSEHVIGTFCIAVACWAGGIAWTNGVLLTPEGIVQRHTFRRTIIPWGSVESFKASPAPRNPAWRTVEVELRPLGHSYLTTVAGRESYIQRVISEFEEYRATLASEPRVSPHSPTAQD